MLEIGAGTGYNAALLSHLVGEAGHVVTMDIDDDIVQAARRNLLALDGALAKDALLWLGLVPAPPTAPAAAAPGK